MKGCVSVTVFLALAILLRASNGSVQASSVATNAQHISSELKYEFPKYDCKEQDATAMLTVRGAKKEDLRHKLSITSILDISSSMELHNGLKFALAANAFITRELVASSREHKFGAVVFRSGSQEIRPLSIIRPSHVDPFLKAIYSYQTVGPTNLYAGLKRGFDQQKNDNEGAADDDCEFTRAVFFFTDGEPTVGKFTDHDKILEQVKSWHAERPDIPIFTFRFGQKVIFNLMDNIAAASGGSHSRIRTWEQLSVATGSVFGGLINSVAYNALYTVSPRPGIAIQSIDGPGTITTDGNDMIVEIDEMEAGDELKFLIDFKMPEGCSIVDFFDIKGKIHATRCSSPEADIAGGHLIREPHDQIDDGTNKGDETVEIEKDRKAVTRYMLVAVTEYDSGHVTAAAKHLGEAKSVIAKSSGKHGETWSSGSKTDIDSLLNLVKSSSTKRPDVSDKLHSVSTTVAHKRTDQVVTDLATMLDFASPARLAMIKAAMLEMLGTADTSDFSLTTGYALHEEKDQPIKTYDISFTVGASTAPLMEDSKLSMSLSLVLDMTDNMDAESIKMQKETAKRLIDWLGQHHSNNVYIGVIVFTDKAYEVLELTNSLAIAVENAKAKIDAIVPGGSSSMDDALLKAVHRQTRHIVSATQTVALISKSPASSPLLSMILKSFLYNAKHPINIYTFGFLNVNDDVMREVAETGKGSRYILRAPKDIPYALGDAIGGLIGVKAKKISVKIHPCHGGVIIMHPESIKQSNGQVEFTTHNIFESESRTFYMTVLVMPYGKPPEYLVEVTTTYVNASTEGESQKKITEIGMEEKDPEDARKSKMDSELSVSMKQALGHCLEDSNADMTRQTIINALSIVASYSTELSTHKPYTSALTSDLISIKMDLMKPESDRKKGRDCSKIELMTNILLTQRSQINKGPILKLESFFDSKLRQHVRTSTAAGIVPVHACLLEKNEIQTLWMELSKTVGSEQGSTATSKRSILATENAMEAKNAEMRRAADGVHRMNGALDRKDYATATKEIVEAIKAGREGSYQDDMFIHAMNNYLTDNGNRLLAVFSAGCDSKIMSQQAEMMAN